MIHVYLHTCCKCNKVWGHEDCLHISMAPDSDCPECRTDMTYNGIDSWAYQGEDDFTAFVRGERYRNKKEQFNGK
jgi:hypothetical protein